MSAADFQELKDSAAEEQEIQNLEDGRGNPNEELLQKLPQPGSSDLQDFSAAKIDNGGGWVKFLAIFMCLVSMTITALMWGTVGLKGADGTDISDRVSSSLAVMASLQTLACLLAIRDVVLVFLRFPKSSEMVKFETQHDAFKRISIPVALTILLFFPTLATFTLHSLGFEFWRLMSEAKDTMDSGIRSCIIFLITSFCCVMLVGAVHAGYAEWLMRTVFWVTDSVFQLKPRKVLRINIVRRILGLLTFTAGGMFYAAQIWTLALVPDNSGVVSSFVIFTIVVIPYFWMCSLQLSMVRFDVIDQLFVQRVRNVAMLMTTVCYLAFWVNLLLLLLEGVWEQGWWETVAGTVPQDEGLCATPHPVCHLNTTRSTVVFFQFGFTLLLILQYGARIFLHKARKKFTLPREEFPDTVLQRRQEIQAERLGVEATIVATHDRDPENPVSLKQEMKDDGGNDDDEEEEKGEEEEAKKASSSAAAVSEESLQTSKKSKKSKKKKKKKNED